MTQLVHVERHDDIAIVRPQARALQHAFFAERSTAKLKDADGVAPRAIERVGVVGGGTMGRGIAMSFANAGIPVRLMEVSEVKARAAVEAIQSEYARQVQRGRLEASEAANRSARVRPVAGAADLADCDLVIEAVYEDLRVKLETCRRLGAICRPDAILASNTSTLDINRLAQASGRPASFVGLHFFSPANIMRLVEVIRGEHTSPETLVTAVALVRRIAKVPVVSGVCWGFIGNRMLEPYLREVEALLLEGAAPSQIDHALEQFGMAMGPCRMMDLAGVDVVAKVVEERAKEGKLPEDSSYRIVSRQLASIGRYGQKSGEGFYRYEGRDVVDNVDARSLVQSLAARYGVKQRQDISSEEILERCMLPLINEGHRILEEGIASQPSDIDVVWLTGYGFPQALGGPMYYGDRLGSAHLLERLSHYGKSRGNAWNYWTPAAALAAGMGANQ
ncbi:MAG: 3-hydroxyacyl-CoA dehydrogenase NAD-binding domain-containing protein [Pseudomonas sp.]